MSRWRYFAVSLPGFSVIDPDLPLSGVRVSRNLSAPGELSGELPIEFERLRNADLTQWHAAIFAEKDGQIRGGGIIDYSVRVGSVWRLECVGHSGYPNKMPYTGDGEVFTEVDPLDLYRFVWNHLQSFEDGNLGVVVDGTTSPVRIGSEEYVPLYETPDPNDTTFDDGPIRFNWYETHDLGGFLQGLAEETPFDYEETFTFEDGAVGLGIDLYYPRRAVRREDLRFEVGVNISAPPDATEGESEYASEVMFLGAGEGREKIRAHAPRMQPGGLRRVAVVVDDTVKREAEAMSRARGELLARLGKRQIATLELIDTESLPISAIHLGDEIPLIGALGWDDAEPVWLRVVGITESPGDGMKTELRVEVA